MNDICRLCLSVINQEAYKLSGKCNILRKIRSCLTVQIQLNKSLPKHVCRDCVEKIEEIYKFHKRVVCNQDKLQQYLDSSHEAPKDVFSKLKNNIDIKNEAVVVENEIKNFIKIECPSNNETNNVNLQSPSDCVKEERECQDSKFNEKYNDNNDSGSDDSVTLSSLKKQQENITANMEIANVDENYQPTKNHVPNTNLSKDTILLNPFTCLTCFEPMESQIALMKHYFKYHRNFGEVTATKYYVVDEAEGMKYKCTICTEMCEKKNDILKHMNCHLKPFMCKICGRTYKSIAEIVRHSRAHNGIKLLCSYHCGFTTAYKGALKEHEKRHLETPDYKYKCGECGKGFFVRTWFEQHQNIHNNLKPFVCDLCGMAFHIQRYLTAHKSTVHQQMSNVKRYVCVHCLHPCDTAKSLAEHLKEHGIKTEFLCDECGKIFKNADKLRNHKYTHLQIKPFTCSICNKSFAKKFSLKLHEIAHTGDKLHACAHCDKRYVQKATLRRHCRRHHSTTTHQNK